MTSNNHRRTELANYVFCPDGTKCENGSSCVDTEICSGDPMFNLFICNCTGISSVATFSGLHCEHEATAYCAFGAPTAGKDSFCANGGKCNAIVGPKQDGTIEHAGCDCPTGFEGDFCQYRVGDPKLKSINEGKKAGQKEVQNTTKLQSTSRVLLFTILLVTLSSVIIATIVIAFRRRKMKEKEVEEATSELDFDDSKSIEIT